MCFIISLRRNTQQNLLQHGPLTYRSRVENRKQHSYRCSIQTMHLDAKYCSNSLAGWRNQHVYLTEVNIPKNDSKRYLTRCKQL